MEETPQVQEGVKLKKLSKRKLIIIAVVILIAVAFSASFLYYQYNQSNKLSQNTTAASNEETQKIIEEVGKLMILPSNEEPTLATVSDKSKLADQPFFANAENGDKVLIYTKAKKAILYRPSVNKIIEVAPVNIGEDQQEPTVSSTPVPSASPTPNFVDPKLIQ